MIGKRIRIVESIYPLFCPFCGEEISTKELVEDSNHLVSRDKDTFTIYCPNKRKQTKVKDP